MKYMFLFLFVAMGFSAGSSARSWHERDVACVGNCRRLCAYDSARACQNDCAYDTTRDRTNEGECEQETPLIDKLPRHRIYREVVPMGYPYANYWINEPYLAPFAGPVRYEQGRIFMFGWAY